VNGIVFEATGSYILVFSVTVSLALTPVYAMINTYYVVFWPVLCVYWWWGQSVAGA